MSAYIAFTRTKTLDQKELEAYWTGIKDTIEGTPNRNRNCDGEVSNYKSSERLVSQPSLPKCGKHRQKGPIYQGLVVEEIA